MALGILHFERPSGIAPDRAMRPSASPPGFNDGLPDDDTWNAAYRERLTRAMQNDRPRKDFRQVHAEMRQLIRGTGGPHARPKKR